MGRALLCPPSGCAWRPWTPLKAGAGCVTANHRGTFGPLTLRGPARPSAVPPRNGGKANPRFLASGFIVCFLLIAKENNNFDSTAKAETPLSPLPRKPPVMPGRPADTDPKPDGQVPSAWVLSSVCGHSDTACETRSCRSSEGTTRSPPEEVAPSPLTITMTSEAPNGTNWSPCCCSGQQPGVGLWVESRGHRACVPSEGSGTLPWSYAIGGICRSWVGGRGLCPCCH